WFRCMLSSATPRAPPAPTPFPYTTLFRSSMLSKKVPGMEATAEVTGGSVDNLKLIDGDDSYIGLTMSDAATDAYKGEGKFKGHKVPVRTLMILYPNRMHVVTVDGRGIEKMADLKGKRIST